MIAIGGEVSESIYQSASQLFTQLVSHSVSHFLSPKQSIIVCMGA